MLHISIRDYFPAPRPALSGQKFPKFNNHTYGYADKISKTSDTTIIGPKKQKVVPDGYSERRIILICHNLRSCHNVGSLLRTAEGLGIQKVFLTGYTPYPTHLGDIRLPHIAHKINAQIQKTALGAEQTLRWQYNPDVFAVIKKLKNKEYMVSGLEQAPGSIDISSWDPAPQTAIIVGRETEGIEAEVLAVCDIHLEIPMFGQKESFNVVQAAAMALYHSQFYKSC